jgi:hypothetical protein
MPQIDVTVRELANAVCKFRFSQGIKGVAGAGLTRRVVRQPIRPTP